MDSKNITIRVDDVIEVVNDVLTIVSIKKTPLWKVSPYAIYVEKNDGSSSCLGFDDVRKMLEEKEIFDGNNTLANCSVISED